MTRETYLEFLNEFHLRIVTVLSAICFAIFAVPLGIFDPRNPKTGKFIYMIVMLVFFFGFSVQSRALTLSGKAHQATLYLPLLFSLAIALINYLKLNYDFNSLKELLNDRLVLMKLKEEKNEIR